MRYDTWLVIGYSAAALLEAGGVLLVVWDVKDSVASLRRMRETSDRVRDDLRYKMDPTYVRYGVVMPELQAVAEAVKVGLGSVRRRVLAVALLLGGIAAGTAANVVAVTR